MRYGLGRHEQAGGSAPGQSMIEFALLLPILLVLLLGVADFGRVFEAGIVTNSAARAAAEAAALEYLRSEEARAALAPGALADYFDDIHRVAAEAACEEARILPNTTYAGPPAVCGTWPAVVACVHDDDVTDPNCGTPYAGFSAGPSECDEMAGGWDTAEDSQDHDFVEVRVCYRFTTLFNLNLSLPMGAGLVLGDIYLQRTAAFTVADY